MLQHINSPSCANMSVVNKFFNIIWQTFISFASEPLGIPKSNGVKPDTNRAVLF